MFAVLTIVQQNPQWFFWNFSKVSKQFFLDSIPDNSWEKLARRGQYWPLNALSVIPSSRRQGDWQPMEPYSISWKGFLLCHFVFWYCGSPVPLRPVAVFSLWPKITKKVQFAATMKDYIAAWKKMNSRKIAAGVLRWLRPMLTGMNVRMSLSISLTE